MIVVISLLSFSSCLVGNMYSLSARRSVDMKMVRNKPNYLFVSWMILLVRILHLSSRPRVKIAYDNSPFFKLKVDTTSTFKAATSKLKAVCLHLVSN